MYKILIFAGTREGRELAEYCDRNAVPAFVCVATEYGEQLLPEGENLSVSHERLTGSEMEELMIRLGRPTVIDATHPYAAVVTENIQTACRRTDTPYLRLVRRETELSDRDVIWKDSLREAVDYLETQEGKILAVTGSKELAEYTRLTDYRERVFARVLSLASVASSCRELGFEGKNLICMQGPFSRELNAAMIRQLGTRFLVTKESGTTGGFLEKYEAAKETGSVLVVIGRPKKEKGLTLEECKKRIAETFGLPEEAAYSCSQQIALVGIGMGERNGMTLEAQQAVQEADLVIGAGRMVEAAAGEGQLTACAYRTGENPGSDPETSLVQPDRRGFIRRCGFLQRSQKTAGCAACRSTGNLRYFLSRIFLFPPADGLGRCGDGKCSWKRTECAGKDQEQQESVCSGGKRGRGKPSLRKADRERSV